MPKKVLIALAACGMLFLVFPGVAISQDTAQQEEQPKKAKDKSTTLSRGAQSLVEDSFANLRHKVGFSVGVFGVYQSNLYSASSNSIQASSATFTSRVYANFGRRRSRLHLDYGAGYQLYNRKQGLNSWEQSAGANYSYQVSRNVSTRIQDTFSSSPNGYGSFMTSLFSPSYWAPGFSTAVLLQRQRITLNTLTAVLEISARKNNLGIFGGYNLYRYQTSSQQNLDGFTVGANYSRQFTKWLYLTNSYSTYLNRVNPMYRDTRIHRLQVGGFKFKLGAQWTAETGGGIELANTYGRNLWGETVNASVAWNAPSNLLSISYNRGFYSLVGVAGVFQSNQAQLTLGSRLTNRLSSQLAALYVRGGDFYSTGTATGGNLNYYSALGGLQFSLFQGLIASANFSYWNQRARNVAGLPVSLNSYIAFAGIQFVFPSGLR